ncbi:hypothetical protein Poly51_50930 [Rubripirellula tenax]|uniref:Uncharacterized protein n=2 Tax=Rubripirellula tenax TaxID=2528015 RepID=A0A5C6EFQ1_9BACT|nr:hypothetical protein Poly51_50930 [Rubripirellula tenax]
MEDDYDDYDSDDTGEDFDYDNFVEDEFGDGLTNTETKPLWRFVSVVMLCLLLAAAFLQVLAMF